MITGELRNKVDRIWETFWTGGIANPLEETQTLMDSLMQEYFG